MTGEGSNRMKWRRHPRKDLAPPGFPKGVGLVSVPDGFKTERQLKVIGKKKSTSHRPRQCRSPQGTFWRR